MRRGLRHLPVDPGGRRVARRGLRRLPVRTDGRHRLGLLGLGVLAALTLVWQQQATLASYTDVEFGRATFTAATLDAITPGITTTAATATTTWPKASGTWATPNYVLSGATSAGGANATVVYSGTARTYTQTLGSVPGTGALPLTDITTGGTHSCGIARGQVYCWGTDSNGALGLGATTSASTPTLVSGLAGTLVTDVSAGTSHTCAVADGTAFCWGLNSNGRLGNGTTTSSNVPVAVSTGGVLSGRTVTAVSAGDAHSCAVADGLAFCWGLNTNGRLGDGTTTSRATPVAVVGPVASTGNVTAVSAGSTHSCAIADGAAYCWGNNGNGQLGNGGTATTVSTPVAVSTSGVLSGRTLRSISAGSNTSCAAGGTPGSCWGLGSSGQLGNGSTPTDQTTPVDADLTGPTCPDGAVRVDAGTCSLFQGTSYWGRLGYSIGTWTAPDSDWVKATTDTRSAVSPSASSRTSTTLALGWSKVSELFDSYAEYTLQRSTSATGSNPSTIYKGGLRTAIDRGGLPTRTSNLDVSLVSSGGDQTCAVLEGSVYCWGDNTNGELGTGNTTGTTTPTAVIDTGGLAGRTVTAVSAAMDNGGDNGEHTCVVADGAVFCWGLNTDGELGDGTTTQRTSPVEAGSFTDATQVATGYMHSCALSGGQVYCWGDNSRGQLGDGTTRQRNNPVLVQGLLAGRTVTAIAAGAAHTCAVADGAVYCWGSNVSGQLGIDSSGSGTNSSLPVVVLTSGVLNGRTVTQVAAGEAHTCVVADGSVYCWGYNSNGQVGDNSTTTRTAPVAVSGPWASGDDLTSLSAGMYHTCVVAAGKAYCWGDNARGQIGNGNTTDQRTPTAVTSGGVLSGTVDQISAGELHTCAVSGSATYCWGYNSTGQLGDTTTTQRTTPVAVTAVAATACASGATLITPTSCSLAPGKTYYYRVKFTVDGNMSTTSDWVGIKTSN
ncbi:MAG: hypothetical protein KDB60_12935 [Propionibacteriaceae bacterium]|nr:hypothetical protein [Propionibacteriaceae bacterium]